MRRLVLDRPWIVLVVVALVALTAIVVRGRDQPHQVRAVFTSAVSLTPGLDVQIDGVDVGKITSVDYDDGRAIVGLGVKDPNVWPLRQGTTAEIRFGTTIGNGTRSVSLHPGPASAPAIPENGVIDERRTSTPVEFDEVFNTLDARTRRRLRSMLDGTASSLEGHTEPLRSGLRHAPAGIETTGDVVGDLLADETALKGLIRNTDRVTRTLAARRPVISDLVTVAASTFAAFGEKTSQMQAALDRFAPTLDDTRRTLARSDSSLDRLDKLFAALGPGARELPSLSRTARRALVRLEKVAPVAVRTLETARIAAPGVTSLLDAGTPFVGPAAKALNTTGPMLACIRPYAPEIAGMFGTWGGFSKNYDRTAHYGRIHLRQGITSVNGALPSAEFITSVPATDTRYALPRPPGLNAGKPYFLPECGITEDALDPNKDPERR